MNILDITLNASKKDLLLSTIGNLISLGYNLPYNWSTQLGDERYGIDGCERVSIGLYKEERNDLDNIVPTHLEIHFWYGDYFSIDHYLNDAPTDMPNGIMNEQITIELLEHILSSLVKEE